MRQALRSAAVMAAFLGLSFAASAQQSDSSTTTGSDQPAASVQPQDKQFAVEAAGGNQAEVELGRMAADKAESTDVVNFGEMMVTDHGKAAEELQQIAQQLKIELPSELPQKAKDDKERLSGLSGAEFDRAYMDLMVSGHEKDIELFQKEADSGQATELKQYAEDTLPVLKDHLEQAKQIQQQLTTEGGVAMTDQDEEVAPEAELAQMTAKDIIGQNVVNENGETVGEIEDILIGGQDNAVSAIISVGGFLGIGEKNVALGLDRLKLREDRVLLMSKADEEQLESMPAYQEGDTDYRAYPRDEPLGGNTN